MRELRQVSTTQNVSQYLIVVSIYLLLPTFFSILWAAISTWWRISCGEHFPNLPIIFEWQLSHCHHVLCRMRAISIITSCVEFLVGGSWAFSRSRLIVPSRAVICSSFRWVHVGRGWRLESHMALICSVGANQTKRAISSVTSLEEQFCLCHRVGT